MDSVPLCFKDEPLDPVAGAWALHYIVAAMQIACPRCGKILEAPEPLPTLAQCPFCANVFDAAESARSGPPPLPPVLSAAGTTIDVVRGPAVWLMIAGAISLVFAIVDLAQNARWLALIQQGQKLPELPEPFRDIVQITPAVVVASVPINFVRIMIAAVIIYGATRMRRLESYGLAMTASILSLVPCLNCGCCLGMPIGIWALVVLTRPEVRASFR